MKTRIGLLVLLLSIVFIGCDVTGDISSMDKSLEGNATEIPKWLADKVLKRHPDMDISEFTLEFIDLDQSRGALALCYSVSSTFGSAGPTCSANGNVHSYSVTTDNISEGGLCNHGQPSWGETITSYVCTRSDCNFEKEYYKGYHYTDET